MDRLQTLTRCVRAPQILAAPETEDTGAQFEAPTTSEEETQCPVLSSGATSSTAGLLPSAGAGTESRPICEAPAPAELQATQLKKATDSVFWSHL